VTAPSDVILEVTGLGKHFPGHPPLTVLEGVDLTVLRGEMVGIVGVSGSGKSTLLQILGLLDHPTQGQLLLSGIDPFAGGLLQRAQLRNRHLGFVYQFHHLMPEFTALENVAMPLLIRGDKRSQAWEQAAQWLDTVGLGHRLEHRPGALSGGEQQRVALARALVGEPDLLLADEPTGNLDPHTAETIHTLLRRLNVERGLTAIVVTHNEGLAATMDRLMHLREGRLEAGTWAAA